MFRQNDTRLACSGAYHLACVIFFLWLDYHIICKALHMFVHRQDLFILYSPCLGLQFLSLHNTVMQQVFFWMSLRADIAEMTREVDLSVKLRRWADNLFKYGAVPFTTLVCVNFWMLYAVLDWPLIESDFLEYYVPPFLNHAAHSVVFFLNVGELVVTPREFPLQKGIFRVTLLGLTYYIWTYISKLISGIWPYIFMKDLSGIGHFWYVTANLALLILSYTAAGAFNSLLWSQHKKENNQNRMQ